MDAYSIELKALLLRSTDEEINRNALQIVSFYRMRRDMQKVAMREALTAMAYREAQVAHQIYSGIVSDLEKCFEIVQAPVQLGGNDRSL